jgi:predicted DNA-binding WGR domain protein/DNA polymerase III delta prime subunit
MLPEALHYSTDDTIAFVLPLFKLVLGIHETGFVAPFEREDALFTSNGSLVLDKSLAHPPQLALYRVQALFPHKDAGPVEITNPQGPAAMAGYLPGYRCFEMDLGHHDQQTDIFCLGLLLGATALNLDLNNADDLAQFIRARTNPSQCNPRIHPTVGRLITETTELDRTFRARDLYDVISRLEHYRDFDPEKQADLSQIPGWVDKGPKERDGIILNKLRNRLFDISRRNRLLYYKPNLRLVNLTVSSVPLVLHYQSIRPELLFTWNGELAEKITGGKEILLNKYLRFEDYTWLPASLDRVRVDARRDEQEYGFSALKLAIAFLGWNNLKEAPEERIQTPLLLLPVSLRKNKKVREDHYILKTLDNTAEVNPVLAGLLRELYGIRLPDYIDLDEMSPEQFYQLLKTQIEEVNQGIRLNYIDKPRIRIIQGEARQTAGSYRRRFKAAAAPQEMVAPEPAAATGLIPETPQPESTPGPSAAVEPAAMQAVTPEPAPTPPVEPATTQALTSEPAPTPAVEATTAQAALTEAALGPQVEPAPGSQVESDPGPQVESVPEPAPPQDPTPYEERFELAEGGNDPHSWDFDVCHMILGNFHYKKMSLVRDYNTVIDRGQPHPSFDALFSERPRDWPEHLFDGNVPEDWFHVVPADPTQTSAILQSRAGYSYIIQGPPGTGKSQTITNLIADFVARGKNILFVCEKRAALDVVYHRLKQVGLEELCCYIHDSQGDKRGFIKNLKTTYEDFASNRMDLGALKQHREALLHTMNRQLELLRDFHDTCSLEDTGTGLTVRALTERLIALRHYLTPLTAAEEEWLPGYNEWQAVQSLVGELELLLDETEPGSTFSTHPFSLIKESIFLSTNPYQTLESAIRESLAALDECETLLRASPLDPQIQQNPERIKSLVQFAVLLYPLARTGNIALADPDSTASREWQQELRHYRHQQENYRQTQQTNSHWRQKIDERDLGAAMALATKYEHAFMGKFNGSWKKFKRQLEPQYDFSAHPIRPSYQTLLEGLRTEYQASAQLEQTRLSLEDRYRFGQNLDTAILSIDMLQSRKGNPDLEYLLRHPDGPALVSSLHNLHQPLNRLETALNRCLQMPPAGHEARHHQGPSGGLTPAPGSPSFSATRDELLNIQLNIDALPDWLPTLRRFAAQPEAVKTALRRLPLRGQQMQAAIIRKTLQQLYATHRTYAATEGQTLEKAVHQLGAAYPALQEINAKLIRAFVRQKFLHQLDLSGRPAGQLTEEQKRTKKTFTEGRKILENEFGKSMRHKSIRDLAEKESGQVLKLLKPVWLMSPYSVSDSLPLDDELFDVVIYDEASQITLEEGVPALYRSKQTIIVGDEKQMPPTDFFSSGSKDKDPEDLEQNGAQDTEWLTDDADSLLAQGARKLTSTLLSWHYRSHYETLISFSNHAFYEGELLTIPDRTIHHQEKTRMLITRPEEAAFHADTLFDRSISFHHLAESIYEKRSNPAEAAYIARLVRELLRRQIDESIGIVAFSQEQQRAIETALDRLAGEDAVFAQQLEEAYNRTANDQFVGLIIKNLENIQGDERDIIIISVCYGPDARRRMLMNFGPVNKKGGEKRLNVLFSRARKHMAVVSSIRHEQITNEYNEGAAYLRRFLWYAELVSTGRMTMARTILDGLTPHKNTGVDTITSTVILTQIKEQLTAMGYEVAGPVGQSDFKCSLAVKRNAADEEYALAILIDDEGHYRNENLVEQYYQRPAILRDFGWKVLPVYAKDWLHQPQRVMEQIVRELAARPAYSGIGPNPGPTSPTEPAAPGTPGSGLSGTSGTTPAPPAANYDHLDFHHLVNPENKTFWEAATEGNKLIVRWGRRGARVQIRLRTFADEAAAQNELTKQEEEQKQKGFVPEPGDQKDRKGS